MSAVSIQQMADRISGLMEERLGARGRTLTEKLRRYGRSLPRAVQVEVAVLAEAADQAGNPRLLMQIDEAKVAEAYDIAVRHLLGINRSARFWGRIGDTAASIVFSLLILAGLVVAVLYWRDLL